MKWAEWVLNGKPLEGVYIFDAHGHIGSSPTETLGSNDIDSVVHTLDRMNVSAVCVSSMLSLTSDWKLGNEMTKKAADKYPGRVFGYASPNPFYPECDLSVYFKPGSGFRGIKIHGGFQANTPSNDPRYFPAYDFAAERGLPVLFHAWARPQVLEVVEVAKRYPQFPLILAHVGQTEDAAKQATIEACLKYDNVFADTAISCAYDGALEYLVSKVGVDKVLYGSDIAFFDCCHTLGKIALSKLSDGDKEKILGLNAKKLFRL